ncbi:serine--tRNA ligase [Candidatus Uhrbacteria bacterium]|nr:serine--tRNA ligase [Candidatus Uhrbacteria bacterium]
MLDLKFILQNPELVQKAAHDKNVTVDVAAIVEIEARHRSALQAVEEKRAEQNKASKGGPVSPDMIAGLKQLKEEIKTLEAEEKELQEQLLPLLSKVPNIPLPEVPVGRDESENQILHTWGEIPAFNFAPKDHLALGEALGMIDTERAAKVAGARFTYLKGDAALLQMALIQHVFSTLTSPSVMEEIAKEIGNGCSAKPFVPVIPPVMIRPDVFVKMARLSPEDKDERYYLQQDDMYLVGSAEHTLGSMYLDEILPEAELPIRYVGYSTSFRREAGSYGKDTKGILRMHQFDKLEMESFVTAENGETEHRFFLAIQEYLMQSLKLPYRVIKKCTADIGNPNASGYDVEAWMPGQNTYRETHTADYMSDYQARRLGTRVRRASGEVELVHTNDATAFAIGRTLIAIMENNQQADGSIMVPEALRHWVGKEKLEIEKK